MQDSRNERTASVGEQRRAQRGTKRNKLELAGTNWNKSELHANCVNRTEYKIKLKINNHISLYSNLLSRQHAPHIARAHSTRVSRSSPPPHAKVILDKEQSIK